MDSSNTFLTESHRFLLIFQYLFSKAFAPTNIFRKKISKYSLFVILFLGFNNTSILLAADPCTPMLLSLTNDCMGPTTHSIPVDGQGGTSFTLNGTCPFSNVDVAWVSFPMKDTADVIQLELIGTNISYELYYTTSTCASLMFVECGDTIIGVKQLTHPSPGTDIEFYLAISEDAGSTVATVDIALESCSCDSNISSIPSVSSPVCEGTPFMLFANPSGGTGPNTFIWTDSMGFTSTNANPQVGTGSGVGSYRYYLNIIDSKGCQHDSSLLVTVLAAPEFVGRDTNICAGQTVDLNTLVSRTVIGDSLEYGTAYGNYALTDSLVTPTIAGMTFTYFLRDSFGITGCVDTAVVHIMVNEKPELVGRDTLICARQTLDLSLLLTQTVLGDSLEVGTILGNYPIDSLVLPNLGVNIYYIRDSIGATSCVDTAQITVTINQPHILGRDTAICLGDSIDLSNLVNKITSGDSLEYGITFGNYTLVDSIVTPSMDGQTYTYFIRDSIGTTGCIDTALVNIYVNPVPNLITQNKLICAGESVDLSMQINGTILGMLEYGTDLTYNGNAVVNPTITTTYFIRDSVDATSCKDTAQIIISVNPVDTTDLRDTICETQIRPFFTQNLTSAGVYTHTLIQTNGCDSLIRLTLTVHPIDTFIIPRIICANQTYLFNGKNLSSEGVYLDTLMANTGCDSIIKLILKVNPIDTTDLSATICSNESYLFNNQDLNIGGTYLDTLVKTNGCDSIIRLNLSINLVKTTNFSASICENQNYAFNNQNLTTSGNYSATFNQNNGCDSIVTLTLIVLPTATTTLSEVLCKGDTYPFNNQNLGTTGIYQQILSTTAGCDSLITLQLTVLDTFESVIRQEICQGASFTFNGQQLTASGTYRDTIIGSNNCSSIVELQLIVHPLPTVTVVNTICTVNFLNYTVDFTAIGGTVTTSTGTLVTNGGNSYTVNNIPANTNFTISVVNPTTNCSTNQAITAPNCICPSINAPVSGGNQSICEGQAIPNLNVSVGNGETVDWYNAASGGTNLATGMVTYTPPINAVGSYNYFANARNISNGCISSSRTPVTLTIYPKPTVTITNSIINICEGNILTLSANPISGVTYQWYKNTNPSLVIGTGQNHTVNNAALTDTGDYFVVATNGQGCRSANSPMIRVSVHSIPSFTINNPTGVQQLSTCEGNDGAIIINNFMVNETYSISYTKNGINQTVNNFVADSISFTLNNLSAGSYDNFIISNQNTSCITDAITGGPFIINHPSSESPNLNVSNDPTTCGKNDGVIQFNNLSNGVTYQVVYNYNGMDITTSFLATNGNLLTITNLGTGNYNNFRITNITSNCISIFATTITLNDPSPLTVTTVNNSITHLSDCQKCDGSFAFEGLVANEIYDVTYTEDGVTIIENNKTADANGTMSFTSKCASSFSNFSFKNTTTQCNSNQFSGLITLNEPTTQNPQIDITNSLNHPTQCGQTDGSIRLANLTANNVYSVIFTVNGQTASFGPILTNSLGELLINNLGAGTYDVFQSTNENTGCKSSILTGNNYILNDPTTGIANINASQATNPSTCGGTDGIILIGNLVPNTTYSISHTKNSVIQNSMMLTSNTAGEIQLTGLEVGSYDDFNLMNQTSQCSISSNSTALILSNPSMSFQPVIPTNLSVCEGESLNLVIDNFNTMPNGAIYYWAGPNGFTSTLAQPTLPQVSNNQLGTYTLVMTLNGCAAVPVNTDVQIMAQPNATIDQSGGVCGENLSLIAQVNGNGSNTNYTYQWTGPNGFTSNNPTVLITNPDDNHSGEYNLIITNNSGCQISATPVLVKIIDNASAKPLLVANEFSFCQGETLRLSTNEFVGNNVQYTWIKTDTTAFFFTTNEPILTINDLALTSGTTIFKVQININGCLSDYSDAITIEVHPKPATPNTFDTVTVCEGESLALIANSTSTGNYQWSGPAGFTSNQQNPIVTNEATALMAGSYELVMEANGCFSETVEVQAIVNSKPSAASVSNNSPICSGETLTLTVNNPINGATYQWFNEQNQPIGQGSSLALNNATPLLSGDYYVLVTQNACTFNPTASPATSATAYTTVEISAQEFMTANAGADAFICEDDYDLTATLPSNPNAIGQWTAINNSSAIIFDVEEAQTPVSHLQAGKNTFVWTLSNIGCSALATDTVEIFYFAGPSLSPDNIQTNFNESINFNVLQNDVINTNNYIINILSQPENGHINLNTDETITYSPNGNFDGQDAFTYEVCATACTEICATTTVDLEVIATEEFATPTVITPNNDGLNDYFIIEGLGHYPQSTLIMFNRWGDEVYRNPDYKNDWTGLYRTAMLPVGTYFYIVEVNNAQNTKLSGYVYIQRE